MKFVLSLIAIAGSVASDLPLDEVMAYYEENIPGLAELEQEIESEIEQKGDFEPGWETSGLSASMVIAQSGRDPSSFVIGEWEVGGHGVVVPGSDPLSGNEDLLKYEIRGYDGPTEYHSYHQLLGVNGTIVIHTYGARNLRGNASCTGATTGITLYSSLPWEEWDAQTSLTAFGMAKWTRDDSRVYCNLYRPDGKGGYHQISYAPDGRPFAFLNSDPQSFEVTDRKVASERIFSPATKSKREQIAQ